jgi:hypothetical protein
VSVEPVWIEWGPDRDSFAAFPSGPCWQCGKPTHWVEVNFETQLCLGACNEAARAEYAAALRGRRSP